MVTIQEVNKYIDDNYGNIRNAKRELGIQSSARVRGFVAGRLGDDDLQRRYEQRAEASAQEARARAVATAESNDYTRVYGAPRDVRVATAERVISDLNASRERIAEADKERADSFARVQRSSRTDPRLVNVFAEAEAVGARQRVATAPVADRDYALSEVDIRRDLSVARSLGVSPGIDYFRQDEDRRRFLVENSPEFRESLGSPAERELFVRTQEASRVSSSPLGKDLFPFDVPLLAAASVATGDNYFPNIALAKENRRIIDEVFDKYGVLKGRRPASKQSFVGKLVNPQSEALLALREAERGVVYRSDLVREQRRFLGRNIGEQLKQGFSLLGDYSPFTPVGQAGIVAGIATNRLAASGLGSVAYTVGSVPFNAVPVVGPVVAQAVDVGLAVPDYFAAIVNPTPRNVAGAQIELIDVGIDYVPEVVGAFAGPVGLLAGSAVPTPNVNANFQLQQEINEYARRVSALSPYFDASSPVVDYSFAGGNLAQEVDVDYRNPGFGGLYSSVTGIPFPTSFNSNVGVKGSSFVNVDYNFSVEADSRVNADVNSSVNANINVSAVSSSVVATDPVVVSGVNPVVSADGDSLISSGDDSFADSSGGSASVFSSSFSSNNDFNAGLSESFVQSVASNLNVNLLSGRGRVRDGVLGKDYFQAFSKVKGVFVEVGGRSSSALRAFDIGRSFVENRPARSFGVAKGSELLGIDVKGAGVFDFKRKITDRGVLFIEPSKRAINTPGEQAGISGRSVRSRNKLFGGLRL